MEVLHGKDTLLHDPHGTDDPTRAGLAFIGANGAKQAGNDPVVALLIDATFLMKSDIPQSITPLGEVDPISWTE